MFMFEVYIVVNRQLHVSHWTLMRYSCLCRTWKPISERRGQKLGLWLQQFQQAREQISLGQKWVWGKLIDLTKLTKTKRNAKPFLFENQKRERKAFSPFLFCCFVVAACFLMDKFAWTQWNLTRSGLTTLHYFSKISSMRHNLRVIPNINKICYWNNNSKIKTLTFWRKQSNLENE